MWWNWDPMEVSGTSVHTLRVNSRGEGVGAPSQPLKTWVLGAPSQPLKIWVHPPNLRRHGYTLPTSEDMGTPSQHQRIDENGKN